MDDSLERRTRRKAKSWKADGVSGAEAVCGRCHRRWFQLWGDSDDGQLRRARYVSPTPEGKWFDPWTGRTTDVHPQVRIDEHAGEVVGTVSFQDRAIPDYAYTRYRINCHSRCGRTGVVVTYDTLKEEYGRAVETGHARICL